MTTMNVFYVVPNDKVPDQEVFNALPGFVSTIQAWFARELDGQTFSFAEPLLVMGQSSAQYYNTVGVWGSIAQELDARRIAPDACSGPVRGTGPYGINLFVTHISIPVNGGTPCSNIVGPDGVTSWWVGDGGGLAMFSEDALNSYLGRPHQWYEQMGWPAQEILHAFTLPHPPFCEIDSSQAECAIAVMWSGGSIPSLEQAILLDRPDAPEKATLKGHPLMDIRLPVSAPPEPAPTPEPPPEPVPEKKPGKRWGRGGRPK